MHLFRDVIDAICRQACAEYPAECCGILTGTSTTQRIHTCRNMQDELHTKVPEVHPRTSREAYAIDRCEVERIIADARGNGESVLAFYHSHIDCEAYFSRMDKEVQTVFGEPEFPDAVHVVVSVRNGKVRDIRSYRWNAERQDFIVIPVE